MSWHKIDPEKVRRGAKRTRPVGRPWSYAKNKDVGYAQRKRRRVQQRRRRHLRRNPAGKALLGAVIGAGLAMFAWKAYVNSRGEGAFFGDPRYMGAIGAGGVVGYLVGGRIGGG